MHSTDRRCRTPSGAGSPPRRSSCTTRDSRTTGCGPCTTTHSASRRTSSRAVGRLPDGERAVRQQARRHHTTTTRSCGSTTTSCSSCRRCCGLSRPDVTIGFFLHIPFPPYGTLLAGCRGAPTSSRVCSAATSIGFQRPTGASPTSPPCCEQLARDRAPDRPAHEGCPASSRSSSNYEGRIGAASARVPDLDRLR